MAVNTINLTPSTPLQEADSIMAHRWWGLQDGGGGAWAKFEAGLDHPEKNPTKLWDLRSDLRCKPAIRAMRARMRALSSRQKTG